MKPLYLDGAQPLAVTLDGPALRVGQRGCADRRFPLRRVSRVVNSGRVSWDTRALLACADKGITICFLARDGGTRARWTGRTTERSGLAQRWNDFLDRPDWRAAMRAVVRQGGVSTGLPMRGKLPRPPDLVALLDVSGSMGRYSRMLIHFLHAAANARRPDWGRVHGFGFGTRLTDVSRWLRIRDPDDCLRKIGMAIPDWEGGTRIGHAIGVFNRNWSRRVLARGAVVLLLTDGLDREDPTALAREAARLRRSARRLLWLNPLLRWDGFTPEARGVAALLPNVDELRGGHSIESLAELCAALSGPEATGDKERLLRLLPAGRASSIGG